MGSDQVVVPSSDQQNETKLSPPKPAPRTHVAPPPKPAAGEADTDVVLMYVISTKSTMSSVESQLTASYCPVFADSECNLCGSSSSLVCPSCNGQCFCDACDGLFHRHPSRASHKRDKIQKISEGESKRPGKKSQNYCCYICMYICYPFKRPVASVVSLSSSLTAPPVSKDCVWTVTKSFTPTPTVKDTTEFSWHWPKLLGEQKTQQSKNLDMN